jgi:capsule polysaccharide export protein KpsE/RkpR
MRNRYEARAFLEEKLGQYAPEDFERYELLHKAENERIQIAENAVKALKDKVDDANELHERAKKDAEASAKLNEQAITHAKALAEDNKELAENLQKAILNIKADFEVLAGLLPSLKGLVSDIKALLDAK